jgi:hypothetical protein
LATGARAAGFKVIIAGAGGAAHLPGMAASMTELPVLGVPVQSKALKGLDSLLSIVQMPGGVPVATLAIGEAGAKNAGILAAQILALNDPALPTGWPPSAQPRPKPCRNGRGLSERFSPSAPGSTIGILGGGQLGRMLSQAASRLGFNVVILDPEENSPAGRVSQGQIVAAYDNPTALDRAGPDLQAVTFEFENVPAASVELLAGAAPSSPPARPRPRRGPGPGRREDLPQRRRRDHGRFRRRRQPRRPAGRAGTAGRLPPC